MGLTKEGILREAYRQEDEPRKKREMALKLYEAIFGKDVD